MATSEIFGWVDRRRGSVPVAWDRRNQQANGMGDSQMTRTTLDFLYRWRWVPWWVMAVIFGVAILPNWVDEARFWLRPVVDMQGALVSKTADSARIHLYGKKLRGVECRFLGLQAFGDRLVGLPVDLIITRVDMPSEGVTKPRGAFDIGVWEVKPTFGVTAVRVYTTHSCDDTRVATKIAEVSM